MPKIIRSKIGAFNSVYILYNYREYITIHFTIIWIYFRCNIYISLILTPVYNFIVIAVLFYNRKC